MRKGGTKDLLYAGDRAGVLHAVDAATGTEEWSRDLGTNPSTCFGTVGVTDTGVIDRSTNLLYVVGGIGQLGNSMSSSQNCRRRHSGGATNVITGMWPPPALSCFG